jgi:hypothetical protein
VTVCAAGCEVVAGRLRRLPGAGGTIPPKEDRPDELHRIRPNNPAALDKLMSNQDYEHYLEEHPT